MKTIKQIYEETLEYEDDKYEKQFRDKLIKLYPNGLLCYHESPIKNATNIIQNGIKNLDISIFASIGKHSEFISGPKISVAFIIPVKFYNYVHHDMAFDSFKELLEQHLDIIGAYIDTGQEHIPTSWFKKVEIFYDKS